MSMGKKDVEATVPSTNRTVFWTTVAVTDITRQLEVYETTLICNTAAAAGTVYLPNVAEAAGMTYTIELRTAGNNLTIKDGSGYAAATVGWDDVVPNKAKEYAVFYSDGHKWAVVDSSLSL